MFKDFYSFLCDNRSMMISFIDSLINFLELCKELGLETKESKIFGSLVYIDVDGHNGAIIHQLIRIFKYTNINEGALKAYDEVLAYVKLFLDKIKTLSEKDFLFKEFMYEKLVKFVSKLSNFYQFLEDSKNKLFQDYGERLKHVKIIEDQYIKLKREYRSLIKEINKYLNLLDSNVRILFILYKLREVLETYNEKELEKFYNSKYYWIIENDHNKELITNDVIEENPEVTILEEVSVAKVIDRLLEYVKNLN